MKIYYYKEISWLSHRKKMSSEKLEAHSIVPVSELHTKIIIITILITVIVII